GKPAQKGTLVEASFGRALDRGRAARGAQWGEVGSRSLLRRPGVHRVRRSVWGGSVAWGKQQRGTARISVHTALGVRRRIRRRPSGQRRRGLAQGLLRDSSDPVR